MTQTAAVLTHGWFRTVNAKTAHGLVRGPSRYRILGLVDHECAGMDAGEAMDGQRRGIPVFSTLDGLIAAAGKPDVCVIGVATPGGVLPPEFRALLLQAIAAGIGVVNGLFTFLSEDPEIAAAARRAGVELIDIRKPKPRGELHFWTGEILKVRAPRLAVLGTDCALGKRTTCHALADACRQAGIRAEIVHTGQTGWLQGIRWGFVLDATVNDFVSGELEHAILACSRDARPELILLEGQSALRNPSGPCGSELLLSGAARGVVLQHAPARRYFESQDEIGSVIPPLREEIALIRLYGAEVLGITLNHQDLNEGDLEPARRRIEEETGLPTVYPLREGVGRLLPAITAYVARETIQ